MRLSYCRLPSQRVQAADMLRPPDRPRPRLGGKGACRFRRRLQDQQRQDRDQFGAQRL